MKIFTTVLIVIALALLIFNITYIDFSNPFEGNSQIAIIEAIIALCAICILLIFKVSKQIESKLNQQ
jgi:NADH:ubiquinone oxidoreductase subunit 2 (subunit N)